MPDYPKVLILNDNTVLLSRPAESKDVNGIYNFFKKIPKSDLLIYQYDVGDIEKIYTWFTASLYKKLFQLVSFKNDEIIAKGTLHQEGIYWQNTAEVKLIIRPDFRGRGLGTQLFNILLYEGLKRNMRKLVVRYFPDNTSFKKILDHYDFRAETTLSYYVKDDDEKDRKDIIIASYNIDDWARRFEFYSAIYGKK